MSNKISAFFYRISTGWVALVGLLIFLLFSTLTLPVESARVDAYSHGLGSPDTSLFYTSERLMQMAEIYGEAGRMAYLEARWGFDLVFPFIYTVFFITSISYLFGMGLESSSKIRLINLFPLLGLILDLAENAAASVAMAAYPMRGTWGQFLAPIITPLKWVVVVSSMLLLLIGLLLNVKMKLNNK